ncbi:MAG: hypothetical protein LBE31_10355 [Deltaproteobacteria bacterium]|jgi:hypothetical protein|nr:hypothetical protein [Deltaproteobacteria bacterium]
MDAPPKEKRKIKVSSRSIVAGFFCRPVEGQVSAFRFKESLAEFAGFVALPRLESFAVNGNLLLDLSDAPLFFFNLADFLVAAVKLTRRGGGSAAQFFIRVDFVFLEEHQSLCAL